MESTRRQKEGDCDWRHEYQLEGKQHTTIQALPSDERKNPGRNNGNSGLTGPPGHGPDME